MPKQNRQIRRAERAKNLRQLETLRLGGAYRRFRLSATENTLSDLATMPEPPKLHRLPGYFICDMPEGRFHENGLEPEDALIFRMIEKGRFQQV